MLEIGPRGTDGLFLSVDEDRNITLEKLIEGAPLERFLASPARKLAQKSWEGKHLFDGRRRVVAAAGPSLATTIPVPLALARDHANRKTRITIAELENLIAQAMARVFNGCRAEAARRFGAGELDAVLVGAAAKRFAVDGRPLASPVGFAGKNITLVLEFTFAVRALFDALAPFFSSPEGLFFAEAPQAHLRALSRVRKLPLNLVVADGAENAALYLLMQPTGAYDVLYREELHWSFPMIEQAIAEAFAVDGRTAGELYCLYHRGELSRAAARVFRKAAAPALAAFSREMERKKTAGPVYLDMPHPLAPADGTAVFEKHPMGELLDELGCTLSPGGAYGTIMGDERRREVLRPLLYFIEAYFDRSGSSINRKLRRRLHWLVT